MMEEEQSTPPFSLWRRPFGPYSPPRRRPKLETACILPGCDATTTHNGGYCCPQHCTAHRELRKTRKQREGIATS